MTQNNPATHLTHENVILLNVNIDAVKPDVVAIDIRSGQNANDFFPLTEGQVQTLIKKLKAHPSYREIVINDSQLIFVKV